MRLIPLAITALALLVQASPVTNDLPHLWMGDPASRWAGVDVSIRDSILVEQGDTEQKANTTRLDLDFQGAVFSSWTWKAHVDASTDIGSGTYQPHDYEPWEGLPYNVQSNHRRTWDAFTARSDLLLPGNASLSAGVDYLRQGPAWRNPLLWRGSLDLWRPWQDPSGRLTRPAPVLFVGFAVPLGVLRYTQTTGTLKHDKHLDKFFHTHRLGVELSWLEAGLSETVVYGTSVETRGSNPNGDSLGRSLEVLYALPFIPYYFAQHYNGDRENSLISLDASLFPKGRWNPYVELLLDDMKSPTAFADDSWWGNKWALTTGLRTTHAMGSARFLWNIEFTRIEPWVYTHSQGAGYNLAHYGQSTGSDLGPNSLELATRGELDLGKLSFALFATHVAHDSAEGGSIWDIHDPYGRTDKTFLAKNTTLRYNEFGVEVAASPLYWLDVRSGFATWNGDWGDGIRTWGVVQLRY